MRRALALTLVCLGVAAGCDRCDVNPITNIPDAVDQIDVFDQKQAAQVDILWMVDNSESMVPSQKKIADRFNVFFHQLIVSAVDYHIGVLALDPQNKGVLRTYDGSPVQGCDGCRFLTKDVPCNNPDVDVSTLTDESAIDAKLASDCPAELVFRKLVQTGTDGPAFEQEFRQVAASLGVLDVDPASGLPARDPPAENQGFIRDDAALFIIFASDEDEDAKNSANPVRYWQRLFESLKGAGNENKVTTAAIVGYPDGAPVPIDEACGVLQTTFDANPSNDDARAAQLVSSIHDLSQPACFGDDDPSAPVESGARQLELSCRTGGLVANLCKSDYGDALTNLGANAAGLLRKFTLSLSADQIDWGVDCTPFTTDDPHIDCDGNNKTDDPVDGPVCVTALGIAGPQESATDPHLVLHDDNTGWTYEQPTNSIRFNGGFVPAPGTKVQVRYLKRPATERCGG